MTIPMVIRVNTPGGLTEDHAKEIRSKIEAEYKRCTEAGVPLVVGPHTEVLWPVERWEHLVCWPADALAVELAIKGHEVGGWQVVSVSALPKCICVVFKRPARKVD